jgi:hypothetical protein
MIASVIDGATTTRAHWRPLDHADRRRRRALAQGTIVLMAMAAFLTEVLR